MNAILLAALLSAPGDVVYHRSGTDITLDPTEKTKLAAAVLCAFPAADTATVQKYVAVRSWNRPGDTGRVFATGAYEVTETEAQWAADDEAGNVAQVVSAAAGDVTYDKRAPTAQVSAECKATHAAFVADAFLGLDVDKMLSFECERVTRGQADIVCRAVYEEVDTVANYLALVQSGEVVRRVGTEQ
jgi:hypothetical protein